MSRITSSRTRPITPARTRGRGTIGDVSRVVVIGASRGGRVRDGWGGGAPAARDGDGRGSKRGVSSRAGGGGAGAGGAGRGAGGRGAGGGGAAATGGAATGGGGSGSGSGAGAGA